MDFDFAQNVAGLVVHLAKCFVVCLVWFELGVGQSQMPKAQRTQEKMKCAKSKHAKSKNNHSKKSKRG